MTNPYDDLDVVRRESVILADSLKLAVYTITMPNLRGEIAPVPEQQVHMTFDNTVMAAMTGRDALKFAYFISRIEIEQLPLPARYIDVDIDFFAWTPKGTEKVFYAARRGDQVLALFRSQAEATLFANQVKRWIV